MELRQIIFYNEITGKITKTSSCDIPRIGETVSFGGGIFKVRKVHRNYDIENNTYEVEITINNKT